MKFSLIPPLPPPPTRIPTTTTRRRLLNTPPHSSIPQPPTSPTLCVPRWAHIALSFSIFQLNFFPVLISRDFNFDFCCRQSEDAAELEWLSRFVDDSFTDFPAPELSGSMSLSNDKSFPNRGHTKPMRQAEGSESIRRCTHCASEKTPQWRTGPLGPKTLCNACGVRYKSGRLVPEYRPAASPTFVLTQHSNSHRKVMELRRQKEVSQQQPEEQQQFYLHPNGFQVCWRVGVLWNVKWGWDSNICNTVCLFYQNW